MRMASRQQIKNSRYGSGFTELPLIEVLGQMIAFDEGCGDRRGPSFLPSPQMGCPLRWRLIRQ